MKRTLLTIALILSSSAVLAETVYPKNPVLRPITLTEGTIAVGGAVAYVEEGDDDRGNINFHAAYGFTDDLTLSLGDIRYRFWDRLDNGTGLELTAGFGIRGYHESKLNGDALALGADITGKYVFNRDFAATFSAGYVKWDEEHLKNKDEYRYSVGLQRNLFKDVTFAANYTYRDLKDFKQSHADEVNLALNYTFSKRMDLGVFAGYSNFDAKQNGYDLDDGYERTAGVYVNYRF
ncbi:porin [Thalassotalea marina]|uniref:Porin domain-containing protein n=1 Tax=Thalassotalea marina TaxID=1673741 RepID=A0A919BIG8_9GAMM|nr:porin [Thalassotalea marina]GHF94084.1 hypothetical protein GCM10017161_22900 [Thalassotalea marina]